MDRPYLDAAELSALFGMKKTSLLNAISSDRFCCPTYKLGRQRVADRKVVEAYFDARRAEGLNEITTKK
tara:strand:- start:1297 stop:1503 length:207 start_codon:yes stop_codon:yes gene_type:complete